MQISTNENPPRAQVGLIAKLNDTCALPPPTQVAGRGGHPSPSDRAYPSIRGPTASGGKAESLPGRVASLGGAWAPQVGDPPPQSSLPQYPLFRTPIPHSTLSHSAPCRRGHSPTAAASRNHSSCRYHDTALRSTDTTATIAELARRATRRKPVKQLPIAAVLLSN